MSPDPLTPRQKKVLDFIRKYTERQGYAPSIQEMCGGLGLSSTATVHKHLQALIRKGHLKSLVHRSRGLSICEEVVRVVRGVEVPLLGLVSAGQPIMAMETSETIELPENMLGRGETFVLRVKGESMIDEAIKDGDLVIVERRQTVQDGEMVIAAIEREQVTLKRLYREGSRIRLQPSNPAMPPIIVEGSEVEIKGVVIGVLRKYKRF